MTDEFMRVLLSKLRAMRKAEGDEVGDLQAEIVRMVDEEYEREAALGRLIHQTILETLALEGVIIKAEGGGEQNARG